jgi:predicted metalloprotease
MRLGDGPSDNFEDRTGQSSSGFGGMGGGNALGCLLPLVMSRFGLGGVVLLVVGYFVLNSLGGLGGTGGILPTDRPQSAASGQSTLTAENRRLLVGTLESTDATWARLFQASGARYAEPRLVAYTSGTQTACGFGQAAAGPFYCPNDQKIYIDPDFFNELSRRFGAPGDAAAAYVIAHEVGHHVQNLQGTLDRAHQAQARGSRTEGNAVQVRVELQADCYAGVWAANARDAQGSILEAGDVEEAMRAAEAVGDDALQKEAQGYVVPDSFTHGSSAQRQAAFQRGLKGGTLASCPL